MSHRAEQIIDAAVDQLRSFIASTVNVYAHRRLSLSADEGELPAITVDFGEDTAVGQEGAVLLDGTIQSLLTVNITCIATNFDEAALRRQLLSMRADVHKYINRVARLGLDFVIDIHYGGANPPEIDVSGETLVGELTTPWGVRYEMTLDNAE